MPIQTLNASPAQIVRQLLIDQGLAVAGTWAAGVYTGAAWPAFDAGEPDKPDNAITVTDTAGIDLGRTQTDGRLVQHYGFQVRIRAQSHPVGWVRASLIRNTLAESVYNETVHVGADAFLVQSISRIGQVLALGTNVPGDKRKLFTVNATVAFLEN